MALINKLEAIADAIRAKTGGSSDLTLDQMVTEIGSISGGSSISTITLGDSYGYTFSSQLITDEVYNLLKNKIILTPASSLNNAFFFSSLTNFDKEFSVEQNGVGTQQLFYNSKLKETPVINWNNHSIGTAVYNTFGYSSLEHITEDVFKNVSFSGWHYYSSMSFGSFISYCSHLESIEPNILKEWYSYGTNAQNQIYNSGFINDFCLRELKKLPIPRITTTKNLFGSQCFSGLYLCKDIVFDTNNGTPYSVTWSNQTIDITDSVGLAIKQSNYDAHVARISNMHAVTNQTEYDLYKNTDNWCACSFAPVKDYSYSKYNHDSAVATINSLPDVSQGSNNTIKFKGSNGSATDGGAINTLTAEEIAVATAKGWTVTMS